jgi:hypothetical protein
VVAATSGEFARIFGDERSLLSRPLAGKCIVPRAARQTSAPPRPAKTANGRGPGHISTIRKQEIDMYITSKGYTIECDENELWTIVYSLNHSIIDPDRIEHSKKHDGMETHKSNYGKEMVIMQNICRKIGRPDIYESMIDDLEEMFAKGD